MSAEYENILRQVPLFSGLNGIDLERVSRLVLKRKFRKSQLIVSEGQELDGFYVVISGQVKVYKLSEAGKEQILHIVGPGGSFAEAAVFTSRLCPANVSGLSDGEMFFVFKDDFIKLIRDNPQLSLNMLASMSRYLRSLVTIIDELALKEVPARLSKYLLDLIIAARVKDKDAVELKLTITKGELSARLGTVGETLSRTFKKLKSRRIINVRGNRITILNKPRLEEIASGVKI